MGSYPLATRVVPFAETVSCQVILLSFSKNGRSWLTSTSAHRTCDNACSIHSIDGKSRWPENQVFKLNTQMKFAQAMGISVHTLRNWEQGRRRPEGSAIALLRIAARHPRIIRENVETAA
jgi:hypothetical protein